MIKRLLVMSTAIGAVGLAAYSFTPVSAGAVQWNAGFSGSPASDSNIIPIQAGAGAGGGGGGGDKQFKQQSSGGGGAGGGRTRQFKQQSSGGGGAGGVRTRQFKQQGSSGGTRQYRHQGSAGGGNWQRQGRWHHGDSWSSGFWRGGLFIFEPFIIGDPCYDYIRVFDLRRGRWVWAWAYICE
jgi:hypothetical protein